MSYMTQQETKLQHTATCINVLTSL